MQAGASAVRGLSGQLVTAVAASTCGPGVVASSGRVVSAYHIGDLQHGPSDAVQVFPRAQLTLPAAVDGIRFVPDGSLAVSHYGGISMWRHTQVQQLLRPAKGEPLKPAVVLKYTGWPTSFDVSPTSKWCAAGCNDDSVHIWRVNEPGADMTCSGYSESITATVFSGSGRHLATTGGPDATVWRFDGGAGDGSPAGTEPTLCIGTSPRAPLTDASWLGNTTMLATANECGIVHIFDVDRVVRTKRGVPPRTFPISTITAAHLAETQDGRLQAVAQVAWAALNDAAATVLLAAGFVSGHLVVYRVPPCPLAVALP
jgi:WD40 repeat protein